MLCWNEYIPPPPHCKGVVRDRNFGEQVETMSGFSMPNISIASIKGAVDELRGTYYPKNETERRVIRYDCFCEFIVICALCRYMRLCHQKIGVLQRPSWVKLQQTHMNSKFWCRYGSSVISCCCSEKYGIIMKCIWNVIDSEGSSWKQVFKVLF